MGAGCEAEELGRRQGCARHRAFHPALPRAWLQAEALKGKAPSAIISVKARQIFDSRGNPTVRLAGGAGGALLGWVGRRGQDPEEVLGWVGSHEGVPPRCMPLPPLAPRRRLVARPQPPPSASLTWGCTSVPLCAQVEAEVKTHLGTFVADVPSGASTGAHEACEMRDGGE